MNDEEKITGGCLCGAVRYEATELVTGPYPSYYCHCRMCQTLSGSAFVLGTKFRRNSFRFTRGNPKFYKSSNIAERGFCANCGSWLVYRAFKSDWIDISTGSLDHPEDFPPKYHSGVESQLPWLDIQDDLPRMRTDDNTLNLALRAEAGNPEK